jgi:hypothetical protein
MQFGYRLGYYDSNMAETIVKVSTSLEAAGWEVKGNEVEPDLLWGYIATKGAAKLYGRVTNCAGARDDRGVPPCGLQAPKDAQSMATLERQ